MTKNVVSRRIAVWVIALAAGCSASTGGSSGRGGSSSTGGSPASSGGTVGSGGATSTGGQASGGTPGGASMGGTVGSGGVTASGGAAARPSTTGAGGAAGTGSGGSATGGTAGAAGSRATGGAGGATSTCGGGTAASGDLTVDLGAFEQTMDGFGVSNTYQSTAISDATADQFFDATKGIGLSIFRLGIKSDGTSWGPISDAQKAAARGAIVWAAPWTPPANCKSNNSEKNGGHLNSSCYDSWASTLAAFPAKAKQSGVTVAGISAQNEPDNQTMYESCLYTGAEMVSFVKVLGPKLKALNPPVKLLAPESTRWERLWGADQDYGNAILADSQAAAQVDILATHMYETQDAVAPPAGVTKPIWVTEMSGVMGYPNAGPSSDIDDGLVWAGWIHAAITIGHASAYHAWWIQGLNSDNEGLLTMSGGTTKRMYALGNYSKFVRPGFRRVDVTGTPPASVQVTAYTNPTDGTVVVVAVNGGSAAVSLPLFLSGKGPCTLVPWVTSASDNLASKTAVAVTGSRLAPMLAAKSVTTFVGKP
ncbi:MAG TPA: glycoside hydrolase [Polyangia bacterium]|nr:glycoside hydrolase [Polyangia bacterium]